MRCPACNARLGARKTTEQPDGSVRRLRRCLRPCGYTATTSEIIVSQQGFVDRVKRVLRKRVAA